MGASASSGSSPSSLTTSPKRWAAKPDQLQDLQDSEPCIFPAVGGAASCPRSCSADHLGAIVDILGVPNGAPQFWENPRRLILSAEKKKVEMRRFVIWTISYIRNVITVCTAVVITCFTGLWSLLLPWQSH